MCDLMENRILIVDNDEAFRKTVAGMVADRDFDPIQASGFSEALPHLRSKVPAVICDGLGGDCKHVYSNFISGGEKKKFLLVSGEEEWIEWGDRQGIPTVDRMSCRMAIDTLLREISGMGEDSLVY